MKKILILLSVVLVLFSCTEEKVELSFSEENISQKDVATIEVNYPKASGGKEISQNINKSIQTKIANEMSLSEEILIDNLDEAIKDFENEYTSFKNDFTDSEQKWEVLVDSEVIYESPEIISISLSTYIDTGGAHGNTHVIFMNFDPNTGEELGSQSLIKNEEAFTEIAIKYFKANLKNKKHDLDIVDSFYGKDFQLPETIGFSDEGVVILYNTYEIAAYSFGITEYVIPFEEVSEYITRR